MSSCIWSDSAIQYAKSAKSISFYKDTARFSAEIIGKYDYNHFVDLGCGSSNLVLDALLNFHPNRKVTCVDAAKGMVAVAKHNSLHTNAEFMSGFSENIHFAPNSICCFLANSAFWMFDFDKTLPLIKSQLKQRGGLLINFSEWDLQGAVQDELRYVAIDQQLDLLGFEQKKHKGTPKKYCKEHLIQIIEQYGFTVSEVITKTVTVTKRDWIEFYKVPAIAKKSLPHLSLSDALTTLNLAMNKLPESYTHQMKWLFIKAVNM
ncbi:hypothetical protein N480_14215 [Pseudoalteromonas luteoviolacea S2607]|uniref:class I SAM-dependent methyltransferase n=1 Tax=Pseudoalteromonas luteoviolacea TaxID=43657 RepID=UPI0007B04ACA|nr:class I SAM-dependent methyltransferase [Pseudoalteromonas luteoviolacea]KZN37894.1 hypothetical protein N480_14215 [Pseudoalteromonas luteoviolacea S2607]